MRTCNITYVGKVRPDCQISAARESFEKYTNEALCTLLSTFRVIPHAFTTRNYQGAGTLLLEYDLGKI